MTPQPVGPSAIASGRPDWQRAHIPGAQHVCMVDDLSDPAGAFPYTLPGDAQIAALLSILDGGLPRWLREGRPVTAAAVSQAPATFQPCRQAALVADAQRVAQAVAGSGERLLNALSPEQFAGTGGAHYGRPGRIPGSLNLPARDLVDPLTMDWQPRPVIAARLAAAGEPDQRHRPEGLRRPG